MATQTFDTTVSPRTYSDPWIRWSAIIGGLVSGMAIFLLLSLLGLAAGFTAIDPQSSEQVGRATLLTGIWTGVSMMIAALVGGYISASLSGLSRRNDGIFHGLVVWAVNTLLFFYLATTSIGGLLGGVFNAIGQGAQAVTGAVTSAAGETTGGSQGLIGQLQTMITGTEGGEIDRGSLATLNQQLSDGDRQGAINTMVTDMGFTQDRAEVIADQSASLYSAVEQLPSGQEAAEATVSGLTWASWFIFGGVFLSMLLSIAGGWAGSRTVVKRRALKMQHYENA